MKCLERKGDFLFGVLLLFCTGLSGRAQDDSSGVDKQGLSARLSDGTMVSVVAFRGRDEEHRYRYLPANLALSRRRDSLPEFSFLPYRPDDTSAIEGAIMHLLLRWGLSAAQERELQELIRNELDSLAVLDGAVAVRAGREGKSWEITSTGALGAILNRGVASSGHLPVTPGSKFAISFRFDSGDANLMAEALREKGRAWGEKFRFLFAYGDGIPWVLEAELGMLIPLGGKVRGGTR